MSKLSLKLLFVSAVFAVGVSFANQLPIFADYVESLSEIIPDQIKLNVFGEVSFDDNIFSDPRGDERSSLIYKAGLKADVYRNTNFGRYGVSGKVAYNYYQRYSHDKNHWDWSISPDLNINFGEGYLTGRLALRSSSRLERISSDNVNYARHYENGATGVLDYCRNPRWGVSLTADYGWNVYTQKEFDSYTYQEYGATLAPYYNVTSKVKVGVRAGVERTTYRNSRTNDDNNRFRVNALVDYQASQMFGAVLEAGAVRSEYEGASRNANGDREWKPDMILSLKYRPAYNVGLNWRTSIDTSDSRSARSLHRIYQTSLAANWNVTSKVVLYSAVGVRMSDEKASAGDTREWFFQARATYNITDALSIYLGYEYNDVDYKYTGRFDYDENVVRLGVNWAVL